MPDQDVVTLVARAKDEASAALSTVDKKIQTLGLSSETTATKFLGLNDAMKGLAGGLAIGAAIAGVTEVLDGSIEAAEQAQVATVRLSAVLQSSTGASREAASATAEGVEANIKLGFTSTELKNSLGTLIPATHSLSEAQSAQATAEDLARFKGISLADATQALVAVEAGRYRGLAQLGINVHNVHNEQEALAAVNAVVQGQAEAYSETVGGKMASANAQMEQAMEQLGQVLLPAVALTVGVVAGAFQGLVNIFGAVGTAIGNTATALNDWDNSVNQNLPHTEAGKASLAAYNSTFNTLHQELEAGNLTFPEYRQKVADVTAAYDEGVKTGDLYASSSNAVGADLDNIGKHAIVARDGIDFTSASFKQLIAYNSQFQPIADNTGAGLDNIAKHAQAAATAADPNASNAVKTLEDNLRSAYSIIISDAEAALFLARGMNAAAVQAQYAAASVAAFKAGHPTNPNLPAGSADSPHNVGFNVGSINSGGDQAALDAYNVGLGPNFGYVAPKDKKKGGGGKTKSGKSAADLAKEAAAAIQSAYQDATKAVDNFYDKQHTDLIKGIDDSHRERDEKIKDAHTAANEKIKADRDASKQTLKDALAAIETEKKARHEANAAPVTAAEDAQSKIEAAQQLRDLQESLATANAGGDAIAIRNATEALQNFQAHQSIDALRSAQQAADAAADAWADASTKAANDAEAVREHDLDVRQAAEDKRYADAQAAEDKRYANQQAAEDKRWEAQRKKYDDEIRAQESGTSATLKNAHATELLYLQQALSLAKSSGTAADVVAAQRELDDFKAQLKAAPGKAAGGRVSAGSLYRVGESGPEFFVPGVAGTIVPGGPGAGAGGIGSLTINVHGVGNPQDVANRVMQALKREADRQGMTVSATGAYSR